MKTTQKSKMAMHLKGVGVPGFGAWLGVGLGDAVIGIDDGFNTYILSCEANQMSTTFCHLTSSKPFLINPVPHALLYQSSFEFKLDIHGTQWAKASQTHSVEIKFYCPKTKKVLWGDERRVTLFGSAIQGVTISGTLKEIPVNKAIFPLFAAKLGLPIRRTQLKFGPPKVEQAA